LWLALRAAFRQDGDREARAHHDPALAAAAMLLIELARSDRSIEANDLAAIEAQLRRQWSLPPFPKPKAARDTARVAAQVSREFGPEARLALYQRLHQLASSGEALRPHEARLLERSAEVLGVPPSAPTESEVPVP
jgi:uncharacterized tellurite resistance protein B-like protein